MVVHEKGEQVDRGGARGVSGNPLVGMCQPPRRGKI